MSKDQIKDEINKVLDQFSDDTLQELLSFLKQVEQKNSSTINMDVLDRILAEDHTLLDKLAK